MKITFIAPKHEAKRISRVGYAWKKECLKLFSNRPESAINEHHQERHSRELQQRKQNNGHIAQVIYHWMNGTQEQLENCLDLDYDFDFDDYNSQLHDFTTVTVYYQESVLYRGVAYIGQTQSFWIIGLEGLHTTYLQ